MSKSTVHFACRLLMITGLLMFGLVGGSQAQAPSAERSGTASIEAWPRSLAELRDEMGARAPYLLPRIDSLALDYQYSVSDTTSYWTFVLSWRPARRVLYEGEVLPWSQRPRDIRMTNVEFRADVRVEGDKRAEMIIGVDSMVLRPSPDRFAFKVRVDHDRVFLDTSPSEAHRLLSEGVTLDPLIVERMGFSAADADRGRGSVPDTKRGDGPHPRPPSVYTPSTRIHIGWRVGPRPYYVSGGDGTAPRENRPRGETVGQASGEESGRTGEEGRSERGGDGEETGEDGKRSGTDKILGADDEDEGDEDDETNLRTPALAAAAAVGLVAFAGGTVGLYGHGDTPIGLTSGYTRPKGGVQVQAAVNSAVIEGASNQKLSLKAIGFYDVFGSHAQPAIGLGVQLNPDNAPEVRPSVSAGLVGNLGAVVLYGGVDLLNSAPEVGVAYNFRFGASGTGRD